MKASIQLKINGEEQDLSPHLIAFTFTDHAEGKADDLHIKLGIWQMPAEADPNQKSARMPVRGDKLDASILVQDWKEPGDSVLAYCGQFAVDQREVHFPEKTVTIKAASTYMAAPTTGEKHTETWENTTLAEIAEEIAETNEAIKGSQYLGEKITFSRIDQTNETDLAFLKRIGKQFGYGVKVHDRQLVVFEKKHIEDQEPSFTITPGMVVAPYTLVEQSAAKYSGCLVEYFNPRTKKTEKTFYEVQGTKGRVLKTRIDLSSPDAAFQVAKAFLRANNEHEYTTSLTLPGHPGLLAGLTVYLKDFWIIDQQKFLIEQAVHTCNRDSGYTTQVKLRGVLEY